MLSVHLLCPITGRVGKFDVARGLPVPHIGWNTLDQAKSTDLLSGLGTPDRVYFVHSYRCAGAV